MLLWSLIMIPVVIATSSKPKGNYVVDVEEDTRILRSIRITELLPSNVLNLSNLRLRGIDKNAFDRLDRVRSLNLENNSLSILPEFVFANLTNLEHLSLADNEISGFANTFVGLNNLKSLNISNNPLIHLRKSHLFGLTESTNITTLGIEIYSLSTELFENPFLRDEAIAEEAAGERDTVVAINNNEGPKKTITDDKPVLDKDLRVKICIDKGTVKLVDVLRNDETLAGDDCQQVNIDRENNGLSLGRLGISTFENGWYRLQGVPIRTLELQNNSIVRVTSELLNGLPEDLTTVGLSNNKIERIEKGIIDNEHIRSLNFAGNAISEIEDGAFEKTKLEGLFIFGNRLKSTKFVATLPSTLISMVLGDNAIAELTDGAFSKLGNLRFVSLTGNNITEVKSQSLRGLSSLRALHLYKNNLKKVEPGAFTDLNVLTLLNLDDNDLENLENGVFAGLEKMEKLHLGWNKFTMLTKDSLSGLPDTLRDLYLPHNAIKSLEAGAFVKVPTSTLDLRGNKISKIERGSFDLPRLRSLNLMGNLLREVDGDSFEGLTTLRKLYLNENGIEKIAKGFAKNLGSLYDLSVANNPIKTLENGALYGLPKSKGCYVTLTKTPVELIQGGLFDDVS